MFFKPLTRRLNVSAHIPAALLFADTQIALADDMALISVELAWWGLEGGLTIPASCPRANAYAERFVLTARTELTDRMLILGGRHLRQLLAEYARHYNGRRPHRSRQLRPPRPDHPVPGLPAHRVTRRAMLGSLINEYQPAA